ncbi:Ca2+-dependent phosphoinositide-specific phospholipase C [Deltaproteobacteria bacterium TL4]
MKTIQKTLMYHNFQKEITTLLIGAVLFLFQACYVTKKSSSEAETKTTPKSGNAEDLILLVPTSTPPNKHALITSEVTRYLETLEGDDRAKTQTVLESFTQFLNENGIFAVGELQTRLLNDADFREKFDTFLNANNELVSVNRSARVSLISLFEAIYNFLKWMFGTEDPTITTEKVDKLPYNQVYQKASHNSYQRLEGYLDQMIYHRIRSIEFDVHTKSHSGLLGEAGSFAPKGDWYVYHSIEDLNYGSLAYLSDGLEQVQAFQKAIPNHEIVTIFFDFKEGFRHDGYRSNDLDALMKAYLGESSLLTPADLKAACPHATTLLETVTLPGCSWPTLGTLKGKFLYIIADGAREYLPAGQDPFQVSGFTAGTGAPQSDAIFYNFNANKDENYPLIKATYEANLVSRVYYADGSSLFSKIIMNHGHHLANNAVNYHEDTYSSTHNAKGFPFQCMDPVNCPISKNHEESTNIIGIEVDSGDIWNDKDSFLFLYNQNDDLKETNWTAFVSTVNSHVDHWAKGCLMARASATSGASYFAVCRPADENKIRIQFRTSPSSSSSSTELSSVHVPSGWQDPNGILFLKLHIYDQAKCARGYAAWNGEDWKEIGAQCFDEPLRLQGLAAASHDGGTIKFLFGNVTQNTQLMKASSFSMSQAVGTVRSSAIFDGIFP